MENKFVKKFKEIETKLYELPVKSVMLLGTMSMIRTYNILSIISDQKEFNVIKKLMSIDGILLEIILEDKKDKISILDSYSEICEELAPILENCNHSDLSEHQSNVIDCAYALIEKWYYFAKFNYNSFSEEKRSNFATFVVVGLEAIEQYLNSKYCSIKNFKERQFLIDRSILLDSEIERINQDMLFLKSDINTNRDIRQRIEIYKEIDILSSN